MSKTITIPLRTCSQCGDEAVCRNQPDGSVLCPLCELVIQASNHAVWDADEVKAVVMPLIERGEDGTALMESYGAVVGGVLRWLIDNPSRLNTLAAHAHDQHVQRTVAERTKDLPDA